MSKTQPALLVLFPLITSQLPFFSSGSHALGGNLHNSASSILNSDKVPVTYDHRATSASPSKNPSQSVNHPPQEDQQPNQASPVVIINNNPEPNTNNNGNGFSLTLWHLGPIGVFICLLAYALYLWLTRPCQANPPSDSGEIELAIMN